MTSNIILGKDLKVGDKLKVYNGYAEILTYSFENNWTIRMTVKIVRPDRVKTQEWITTANTVHYPITYVEKDYSRFSMFRRSA